MRIGIDYTSAARQRAGIGRYTRELVRALLMQDDDVHQYAIFAAVGGLPRDRWSEEVERLRAAGNRRPAIHGVPISDEWLARIWHRVRLPIPVELITGRLDVFYSPDFTLPPTRGGTRTLLTVHDLSFVRHPQAFVPALRHYLERVVPRSMGRADVVLADSAHTRFDIMAFFGIPPDRVTVITPGVGSRFRPDAPWGTEEEPGPSPTVAARLLRRYGIGKKPYVLSVGTLQPRKNYVRLIRAFSRTDAVRRGGLQLLIVGGRGWLYEDVLIEAAKHDRVRVVGFVEDEDLPAIYRGASLFVFPSLYEGFGLPVLESMACGVPVICSNTSSLPEVAGNAALLVDPTDVDALAATMDRALSDPALRRAMITRGLEQAARFDWERSARQLLDVIERWET